MPDHKTKHKLTTYALKLINWNRNPARKNPQDGLGRYDPQTTIIPEKNPEELAQEMETLKIEKGDDPEEWYFLGSKLAEEKRLRA